MEVPIFSMIYLPTFGSIHLDDVWGNKSMLNHGGYSSSMEQYFGYGSAKVSALRRLTSLNHLKLSLKPDPWHKPCGKLANFWRQCLEHPENQSSRSISCGQKLSFKTAWKL